MSLRGSLDDLPLPDIVQMVAMSGKTGAFVLESAEQKGEIYLVDGQLVHAKLGGLEGEEAVYEFAVWRSGDFTFHENRATEHRTIQKSNTSLLMEAARRIDEWAVLSKQVPSTDLVPVLASQTWSTSVSFSPQEWSVICGIDGGRTVDDIAEALSVPSFEVAKLLYGLVTAGLVELREPLEQRHAGPLRQMSRSELTLVVNHSLDFARFLLGTHDRTAEVEAQCHLALSEVQLGRGSDAVLAMIRTVESTITTALGPIQARLFTERVRQQLKS